MIAQSRKMIKATMDAAAMIDETLTADKLAAALDALEGRGAATAEGADGKKRDYILTRMEVAERLKCSPKSVTRYAKRGIIRPIRLGKKGERALGYSGLSVEEAIEKGAAAALERATA